jgi:hypothetical protein
MRTVFLALAADAMVFWGPEDACSQANFTAIPLLCHWLQTAIRTWQGQVG